MVVLVLLITIITALSSLGSTAQSSVCGFPGVSRRIVGGIDSVNHEWPWQVNVYFKGQQNCGGSLIASQWVLTAAHCFSVSDGPEDYKVYLGMNQLDANTNYTIASDVATIIVNSNYKSTGSVGDIALLKLANPVTFTQYIMPICLPSSSIIFPCGMECWVTGWGKTSYNGSKPANGILQKVMVPLIDYKTCDQMYHIGTSENSNTVIIQDEKICAGYRNGEKDSCKGDSGGPLVCKVQGVWYQIGLVSWGEGCALQNRPGVYTLVTAYEAWISSYVQVKFANVTDIPSPTYPCGGDYIITSGTACPFTNIKGKSPSTNACGGEFMNNNGDTGKGTTGHSHHQWTILVLATLVILCL